MNPAVSAISSVVALPGVSGVSAPPGVPLNSISSESVGRFNAAYEQAASQQTAQVGGGISTLIDPLLNLNQHSSALAQAADVSGANELGPGELLTLTMRSHEFLFHCELVSNVANRSSDGLQQLFRQQS